MFGHKTLQCKYTATSSRERDELGQELRLRSQFSWTEFAQSLCNLCTVWRPLKQSFYLTAKTPPGDFQVTTTETPLLSQQAVTSKGILSTLLTDSWTLIPIPNWTCSIVTVPLSDTWLPSTWLISCADPSTRLQTPTKEVVGYKVLQFIHMMKIKKMLDHKTLRCTYTTTSSRERDELGQKLRLWSQFAWTKFAQCLCNLWTVWRPLK